jgi:hypothetical protein
MAKKHFVVCIDNSEYPASLEIRKIYEVVPDAKAKKLDQIRIIDESGEDYLYPSSRFIELTLSKPVVDALSSAA